MPTLIGFTKVFYFLDTGCRFLKFSFDLNKMQVQNGIPKKKTFVGIERNNVFTFAIVKTLTKWVLKSEKSSSWKMQW